MPDQCAHYSGFVPRGSHLSDGCAPAGCQVVSALCNSARCAVADLVGERPGGGLAPGANASGATHAGAGRSGGAKAVCSVSRTVLKIGAASPSGLPMMRVQPARSSESVRGRFRHTEIDFSWIGLTVQRPPGGSGRAMERTRGHGEGVPTPGCPTRTPDRVTSCYRSCPGSLPDQPGCFAAP